MGQEEGLPVYDVERLNGVKHARDFCKGNKKDNRVLSSKPRRKTLCAVARGNIKGQETRAKFLEEQRLKAEENRRKLAGENRNATR